ncbi:hypothetical protein [uncultured Pontibacter sp.]|uniref:hypothetical protein n=1 Tax=uncultured Pontibacter sp. TaxID=453356 RepID=UPI002634D496|nr:hypothetical protein [uncultured Pontibacter sp.]
MSAQPQYIPIAKDAFGQYLDSKIDLHTLIQRLQEIELQVLSEEDEDEESGKSLWFRFFDGDTLATTINEIEKDLADPAHPNSQILLRGIAYGLQSDELEVHYS